MDWTLPFTGHKKQDLLYITFNKPTNFKNMSIKPYFQSKNTNDIKLDKLKVFTKLDKLKAPTKLDKLKVPIPTLKVPQKPIKPAIKYS